MKLYQMVYLTLSCVSLIAGCSEDRGNFMPAPAKTSPDGGLTSAASPASTGDGGVTLTLESGKVEGSLAGGAQLFLGIPYAKPPVGPLRFMPSEPAEPWSTTLKATKLSPSCLQPAGALSTMGEQSEDCLTLNVYKPAGAKGPLPVMVWIHGGGFTSGGSNQYDGTKLAVEGQVVVVTLNYRLGALGFLSLPELDAQRGDAPSGNDGLRDQQLALRWVKDNIDAFGGDPASVTVFGESAGSASGCVHLVSPRAAGLAQRFILESGSCIGGALIRTKEQAAATGAELSAALCSDGDTVECLQGLEGTDVIAWGNERGLFGAGWAPTVNPDDDVLPEPAEALIEAGKYNQGAVILGTNKNEWGLFTFLGATDLSSVDKMHAEMERQFATIPAALPAIKAHYPATDVTASETYVRLVTDGIFRCPTRALARALSAQGSATYLYSFEQGAAYHAYELPFVFGNPNPLLGVSEVEPLHGILKDYWTSFAKTGEPVAESQPEWPAYDAEDRHLVLTDEPSVGSALSSDDCDFWDTLSRF
jgi:para-nitrobenzyl esterase